MTNDRFFHSVGKIKQDTIPVIYFHPCESVKIRGEQMLPDGKTAVILPHLLN